MKFLFLLVAMSNITKRIRLLEWINDLLPGESPKLNNLLTLRGFSVISNTSKLLRDRYESEDTNKLVSGNPSR